MFVTVTILVDTDVHVKARLLMLRLKRDLEDKINIRKNITIPYFLI